MEEIWLSDLRCCQHINPEKAGLSLGTLGGGNHFIEVDRDEDGFLYVVIHSGSRRLGKEVTELPEKGSEIPKEERYTGSI